ncbi:MAG: UTP--glucose-1-phosphate uridylyltransferase GalU [Actinobacteria bacterium]|nr:UTP--glucose-1-phosphate uridylyltransferase GalU [Actinomycetota bacterium]MBW3650631.1 UTP--glucose-1-phosphate uridylyltransferase GalU [Actinomycetota bacterium]
MTSVTKAVIPAAGLGTRFLPATKAQPKEMLPIVDKPAIQYAVEEAVRAGLDDILVITGRNKRSLEDHFDRAVELEADLEAKGKHDLLKQVRGITDMARLHYVRQGEALGLGHAVSMARQHVGPESFAVMLPDDLMHERTPLLQQMLEAHERVQRPVIALLEVGPDEISAYGCAEVEPVEGEDRLVRVTSLVEKPSPEDAPSNLAVIGRYVLTPDIFDALDAVVPGAGGEIQLTDAIAAVMGGAGVYGYTFSEGRFDTGNKIDYLRAVVELALEHDEVSEQFRAYLGELARRESLT